LHYPPLNIKPCSPLSRGEEELGVNYGKVEGCYFRDCLLLPTLRKKREGWGTREPLHYPPSNIKPCENFSQEELE
jgi:hypothetical protein